MERLDELQELRNLYLYTCFLDNALMYTLSCIQIIIPYRNNFGGIVNSGPCVCASGVISQKGETLPIAFLPDVIFFNSLDNTYNLYYKWLNCKSLFLDEISASD